MRTRGLLLTAIAVAWLAVPAVSYAQVPCGAASLPMCDGACPDNFACMENLGFCDCVPSTSPCGIPFGPPECWGECPSPTAPICADVGGTCQCVPTLSEWGIIGMSFAMLAGVFLLRRRRQSA